MAHKTLISGTSYDVSGGKTLIDGTAYGIAGGKTLVNGTAYDISFAPPPLAECTPAQIQKIAQSGNAPNYWSVGDKIGITLNGTVRALTFSNETYYAFIIGFDHNSAKEGSNTIHFQFGKLEDGRDIAFADAKYGESSGDSRFYMNGTNTTSGGYASSSMRKYTCPAFLAALPTEWQNVISACIKYSDNTGGGSDTASYVTATQDKIFLLAEYEVFGTRSGANSAEQNYQKQYAYYANGNSKRKHKYNYAPNQTNNECNWFLRSVKATSQYHFCIVNSSGDASTITAYRSEGFAPGFMVA